MPEDLMTATATADGDQLETQDTQVSEQVETGDTGLETGEQQIEQTQTPPEKTFTQAQLDEIIQKRLAKEQSRLENEKKSAAQQARDAYIAEQRYEWPPGSGKLITTEAEYQEALRESELMQRYQNQGLPDDVVQELIENRKFREQYQTQQQQIEAQRRQAQAQQDFIARRDAMYSEFLDEFPDYNTEESWAKIPAEVWVEADKWMKSGGREGRRLADALTRHNWKQTMAQDTANQVNQTNAAASTGSVKTQGAPKGKLTEEMIEAMTDKERMSRWPEIKKALNIR